MQWARRELLLLPLLLLPGLAAPAAAQQEHAAACPTVPPASLLNRLREDFSFKVRIQAAIVLGRYPSPQTLAGLLQALKEDVNPMVRAASAISLGRIGYPEARQALTGATGDAEALVANAARQALVLLDVAEPVPTACLLAPPPTAEQPPPPPAAPAGAEPDGMIVSGPGPAPSPDPAEVERALEELSVPFQPCGPRQLKRNPHFAGVQLELRILPDGRAVLPPAAAPPLNEERFRSCIEQALAGLQLPPASGGELKITWPLRVSR